MALRENTARLVLAGLLHDASKIVLGDTNHRLTRSGLLANVAKQAECLRDNNVKANEFVLIRCDRGLTFWIELLASWVIGAKPICVESDISEEHAAHVANMTSVGRIFGELDRDNHILGGLQSVHSSFDPFLEIPDLRVCYESIPFAHETTIPDMAGLIFTSGTTGLPKGVPLTHRVLNANALATAHRLRLRSDDRLMVATPFRFISSISHFLVTLISDAAFFGIEKPMLIKDLLSVLNGLEITAFGGSPFHVQFIAMAGQQRLPHLRWAMSSGDHLRPAVIEQLTRSFDEIELHVVYGMAELGGRLCELPPEALASKAGSVGFPVNGYEITVRREDGSLCAPGENGNIHVSGQLGFDGYYDNPDANRQVILDTGFLNGDKGYLDEDGYLYLSGRSDSVFKRAGLKVSSQVISDAMMEIDQIRDVFVGSEEDLMEGRVPVAYVCWKDARFLEDSEITRLLRDKLPVNHIPARFISLSTIPRTGSGKVDRNKLRALIDGTGKA